MDSWTDGWMDVMNKTGGLGLETVRIIEFRAVHTRLSRLANGQGDCPVSSVS